MPTFLFHPFERQEGTSLTGDGGSSTNANKRDQEEPCKSCFLPSAAAAAARAEAAEQVEQKEWAICAEKTGAKGERKEGDKHPLTGDGGLEQLGSTPDSTNSMANGGENGDAGGTGEIVFFISVCFP